MVRPLSFVVASLLFAAFAQAASNDGWIPLFDGKSLNGWKASENPDSIKVSDGQIVCSGPRAHLFYVGPVRDAKFKNFELKADVMTTPGANSGIYFHSAYQEEGWPGKGYETQINNSHKGGGGYIEYKKTGSLYGVRNQYRSLARDNEWFTLHIVVRGQRIQIKVNDTLVTDYVQPIKPARGQDGAGRVLSRGTFALQCHDPESTVRFKNIVVKTLPDDLPAEQSTPTEEPYAELLQHHMANFPLIDYHAHLKGGLTLEDVLALSRTTGINYGLAPNCGVGFPITTDQGIYDFLKDVKGKPVFIGMQAEGREWVKMFSKEAIAQFDYVFTDAMTFTDDNGRRTRLWIDTEVTVGDKQAFMDMLVNRILSILNNEPIDIYANPTFLPSAIAAEYDQLWTTERMQKVIDAAVKNDVAVEINARFRIPSATFIKLAKKSGVKFSFGTNNGGKDDLGQLDYCLQMVKDCGLTSKDLFMPKPEGKKKIQMRN